MHVDAGGDYAGLHGTHLHHADPDDHDHSGDIDVSLLEELVFNWSKLVSLLFVYALALVATAWVLRSRWAPPKQSPKIRQRTRWRPPLRAPPIPA